MSRTRAFFLEEATECLRIARSELERPRPEGSVVYGAVRRLRGSAQLARFPGVARTAAGLERRLHPRAGEGALAGGPAPGLEACLDELEEALRAVRAGEVHPQDGMETSMDGQSRTGGVMAIEELEYSGTAALERALVLRQALEDAIVAEAPAGPILDELFDLIRLGMR